jgi:hypothetical protein
LLPLQCPFSQKTEVRFSNHGKSTGLFDSKKNHFVRPSYCCCDFCPLGACLVSASVQCIAVHAALTRLSSHPFGSDLRTVEARERSCIIGISHRWFFRLDKFWRPQFRWPELLHSICFRPQIFVQFNIHLRRVTRWKVENCGCSHGGGLFYKKGGCVSNFAEDARFVFGLTTFCHSAVKFSLYPDSASSPNKWRTIQSHCSALHTAALLESDWHIVVLSSSSAFDLWGVCVCEIYNDSYPEESWLSSSSSSSSFGFDWSLFFVE